MNKKAFNYKNLSNREWYHQRFDGCPMFLFAVGEAEVLKEKRKPKGTEANFRISFFEKGKADWYLDMADVERGAKVIVKLAKSDPNISDKLLKAWEGDEKNFEKFFYREFPKINLAKLPDKKLIDLWNRYYFLFIKRFTSSSIIDHFALGTDQLIEQMLRKEVESKVNKKVVKDKKFGEIFAIATAPVRQSFINLAEVDLLKIAAGVFRESLSDYQKTYFWTKNNYNTANILTVGHFRKEIDAWKKSGKNLKKELKRIKQTPVINRKKKEQLFKEFKFSRLLKTLIKISEDFSWWQDERKKSTYLNIHIGSRILQEIGKRSGYTLEELKYAVAPEIPLIMKSKNRLKSELRDRRNGSVFLMSREGYKAFTGSTVKEIRRIILGDQKFDQINDFRGLSASTGKATGIVRIIKSSTEVSKIKPGDILVAVMTRPDYVVAMKKAAAIVTNEGGITSHAAIVSRELGIPCIIGTKIATEVLKDGDLVEVNANHGWVRKIK